MKVKDCMCEDVCTIKPESTLKEVAKMMSEKHIGCMPVCDNNKKVIGILTLGDIAQNRAKLDDREICITFEDVCDCDTNKNAE